MCCAGGAVEVLWGNRGVLGDKRYRRTQTGTTLRAVPCPKQTGASMLVHKPAVQLVEVSVVVLPCGVELPRHAAVAAA